jgi:hypothetical protein
MDIDFLLGIPTRTTIDGDFNQYLLEWLQGQPVAIKTHMGNRVDVNRNFLWEMAKFNNLPMIMIDTDVFPITPYTEIKKYIKEDFDAGYDVVFAPLLSRIGTLLFTPDNPEDVIKDTPYPVTISSFGFVAFSQKVVKTYPKLTEADIIRVSLDNLGISNDDKQEIMKILKKTYPEQFPSIIYAGIPNSTPVYFSYTSTESEDANFCRRAKYLGYHLAVDPRISVSHRKVMPLTYTVDKVREAYARQKQQTGTDSAKLLEEAKKKRLEELSKA